MRHPELQPEVKINDVTFNGVNYFLVLCSQNFRQYFIAGGCATINHMRKKFEQTDRQTFGKGSVDNVTNPTQPTEFLEFFTCRLSSILADFVRYSLNMLTQS